MWVCVFLKTVKMGFAASYIVSNVLRCQQRTRILLVLAWRGVAVAVDVLRHRAVHLDWWRWLGSTVEVVHQPQPIHLQHTVVCVMVVCHTKSL